MGRRRLTVEADRHSRRYAPVSVPLDLEDMPPVSLTDVACSRTVPCQLEAGDDGLRVHWIVDSLEAGANRCYELAFGDDAVECESAAKVTLEKVDDERVDIAIGGEPFTSYYFGAQYARPFLHPIRGETGNPVTRGFPMIKDAPGETQDHPHHRSCWVAWGDVNGVDDWSEGEGHGWVVHQEFRALESGGVAGLLCAVNDWVSSDRKKVMTEERTVRIYGLPQSHRLLDFTVTFKMTEGPVRFGDTKEGGILSFRVATTMDGSKDGRIENSYGGVTEAETWGKRAHWCHYSGPVESETSGVGIFDHPSNLRHPTYWHVRDYGLMTANPFGVSHFKGDRSADGSCRFEVGSQVTFRYRLYVHTGDATAGKVGERYHDYVNPPRVVVADV